MAKFTSLLVIVLVIGLVAACGKKDATAASSEEMDEAIKQYILNNPEVIIESLTKYQKEMSEMSDEDTQKQLSKLDKDIYKNPNSPVIGNPKGKTIIVEFFDYNCGFCKKSVPDLLRLIDENKDIKIILKELPVLGASSEAAALSALVVHDIAPEKYFAYHQELMNHEGGQDEPTVRAAITKVGLNADEVTKKMAEQKYKDILDKNTEIARSLKISGTPTFIVNGKILRGAAGYDGIKDAIEAE